MARPLLLDLFCGAGGASMGYYQAGFDVVGVDINPQPNYPFKFVQGNVLDLSCYNGHWWLDLGDYYATSLGTFDAIHASPPCQRFSLMSNCRPGLSDKYADLVEVTRKILLDANLPFIIENVEGSPLIDPITLCGQMFGLELYRHRLFESNKSFSVPEHPEHLIPASKAGHWKPGTIMSVAGHVAPIAKAREIMGIDWTTRDELTESIPPAYTKFLGEQLLAVK